MSEPILALYDCRSKQEYIYRTNKIKEIAGASALLADIYPQFFDVCAKNHFKLDTDWKSSPFSKSAFLASDLDAAVLYEGGGNLCMLYKSKDLYLRANRLFSRLLTDISYTIRLVASCTNVTDDFNADFKRLYAENTRRKNLGTDSVPCNVLPFTQLDRVTWMPVLKKKASSRKNGMPHMYTHEAICKRDAYENICKKWEHFDQVEELDRMVTEKGKESLLAIIYIDGNAMGKKLKTLTDGISDYDTCVKNLRNFSIHTQQYYVDDPLAQIRSNLYNQQKPARLVIGGGDEMTLICNARDAAEMVLTYFETLEKAEPLVEGFVNASCAGIAIFHSHAPFSDVYRIAEQACEMGKKRSRRSDSTESCIDFHYCTAGIVNELDVIRQEQEADMTARPYSLAEFREIFAKGEKSLSKGEQLASIGRSELKALRDKIYAGTADFKFELERIKSYGDAKKIKPFLELCEKYKNDVKGFQHLIYDVSLVYDLWFAGKGEQTDDNSEN